MMYNIHCTMYILGRLGDSIREHLLQEKNVFFRHHHPPNSGNLYHCTKNDVLTRITEPSNNDYDNDVSDNCDHNFGTFDDLVLKMTKRYDIT